MKLTKKDYKLEFNKIIKEFNLNKKDKNHKIDTIYGGYTFIFSDDTIFGRFDNVELIKDINKCITKSPSIGIIPLEIGIPISVIGIDARSAIIIAIASSNGCNCPISLFPINLITIKTIMYKIIALINVINI